MAVTIQKVVYNCKECPLVTNNQKEHDCAFTDAPLTTVWYCTHYNGPKFMLTDEVQQYVSPKCPFRKESHE